MADKPRDLSKIPPYNVCIAKPLKVPAGAPPKNKFVNIGVAWPTNSGAGLRAQLDLTIIVGPGDQIMLLPNRNHPDHAGKRPDEDFGAPEVPR